MAALNKKFHTSWRTENQQEAYILTGVERYVQDVDYFLNTPLSLEDSRLELIYSNYQKDSSAYETAELLNKN